MQVLDIIARIKRFLWIPFELSKRTFISMQTEKICLTSSWRIDKNTHVKHVFLFSISKTSPLTGIRVFFFFLCCFYFYYLCAIIERNMFLWKRIYICVTATNWSLSWDFFLFSLTNLFWQQELTNQPLEAKLIE